MHYTIESDSLRVQVNLTGMELSSIVSKVTGQEYLRQGDPRFWTGQAPILFPNIGTLKNGKTSFEGKDYALPKHGFVRNSSHAKLIQQLHNALLFRFDSSPETMEVYPFTFALEVSFRLSGNSLEVSHQVFIWIAKCSFIHWEGIRRLSVPFYQGSSSKTIRLNFQKLSAIIAG